MPFQIKDETAGRVLFFIDNAGQLGLGSLPNNGQKITVLGASVLDSDARFADGTLKPGVPAAYYGQLSIPAYGSANVAISTAQAPSVTSTYPATIVTTSSVTFANSAGSAVTNNYSIW
jgi:hypothetical protein